MSIQNLTSASERIRSSSVVMVLAFRPGVLGSNPARAVYFCFELVHMFLYKGLCL